MTRLQISMLAAICIYFVLIFYLLTKKRINLKYTLLWLALGSIMLVFIVFPGLLRYCTVLIGVETPTNGLFAVLFFAVLVILMSLTAIVSKLNEKSKRIIQVFALMEKRVRELEEKLEESRKGSRDNKTDLLDQHGDEINGI